jgi:hypothetical protein
VFVERLWRGVKYEKVYLRAYESVSEARTSTGRYLEFYNGASRTDANEARALGEKIGRKSELPTQGTSDHPRPRSQAA